MRKNYFRNKKTCADLNFWAMNPKYLHVVDSFMAYILWKFQADSLKIEVSGSLFIPQKILRILDRLSLHFHAIKSVTFTDCRPLSCL